MTLRSALVVGVAWAALFDFVPCAWASELTVAVPAGPLAHVLAEGFITPFSQATGITAGMAVTDGGIAAARDAHADLLALAAEPLAAGCKDGSLQKLDWPALGGRDRQLAGTASDCGLGAVLRSTVLAWNRDKFAGTPTWVEFWDVAKVPGKRGLRRGARNNLELALMADGVAPSDVYASLRTDAGVERAFRKLDQLKPYLVWWQTEDEAPRLLESGEALMTSAPAEGIVAAQRGEGVAAQPGFAVQWSGSLTSVESWAVPAATPPSLLTTKFLAFAADPKNQRKLPTLGAFGGAANGADDGLPPELLAVSPSAPANLQASLMIDDAFWRDNGPKLDKVFDAWVAK